MIPFAISLRVLNGNEIRPRGNISKPELPLIFPPLGRFQLRPFPGTRQNQVRGEARGNNLTQFEKVTLPFPQANPTT